MNQGTDKVSPSSTSGTQNNLKDIEKNIPASSMLLPEFPSDEVVETDDDAIRDKVRSGFYIYLFLVGNSCRKHINP